MSMAEVVSLPGLKNGVHIPDRLGDGADLQSYAPLVEMLERLTALARSGELRGAAVVMLQPDSELADAYASAPDNQWQMHVLTAGVGYLHARLCASANRTS